MSWQRAFTILLAQGVHHCHLLHYLQMATEKIAKAYYWRSNSPPPLSHGGFVQFLRFLGGVQAKDRTAIKRFPEFADT